ncbi:MAG: hypothetical protein KH434_05515 [Clostridium sp.]|nr:hypothetical protein [Clostridium sp.]
MPKKEKTDTKAIAIYTIAIISCIIAVVIVCITQFLGKNRLEEILSIGSSGTSKQEIDEQALIAEFDNIFNNNLEKSGFSVNIEKQEEDKDIIYTYYNKTESKKSHYELNLQVPYINIDNEIINQYNNEIKETFQKKAEKVLETQNKNIVYTVKYQAIIEENILSLIIKSELKEGTSAQRQIIKTYNYDLINNKEIKLEEMISRKGLRKEEVQRKIRDRIKIEEKKVEDLKNLGYNIFERNSEDEQYNIENTKEFFIKNQRIYIIYPYGNESLTTEMDVVVI